MFLLSQIFSLFSPKRNSLLLVSAVPATATFAKFTKISPTHLKLHRSDFHFTNQSMLLSARCSTS
jgi:hypothetical protein